MSTQLAPVDDPNAIDPFSNDLWTRIGPVEWTDYAGATPQADGEVEQSGGSGHFGWTQTRRYFGLGGDQALDSQGAATATSYWHEDLIGSRSMLSDDDGDLAGRIAYAAFGELLDASGLPGGSPPSGSPRYQYAAAHGYESDLLSLQGANADLPPITLQHLGHRWYQPDIGRFVQRDPIGIAGGLNVYAYVVNDPVLLVDPTGLAPPRVPGQPSGCPVHPVTEGLPRDPQGWLKLPPYHRYAWSRRVWEVVPKVPTPRYPPSASAVGGGVAAAAAGGAVAGTAMDYTVGALNRGYRLSDGLGDCFYRLFFTQDPFYNPWGRE